MATLIYYESVKRNKHYEMISVYQFHYTHINSITCLCMLVFMKVIKLDRPNLCICLQHCDFFVEQLS